MEMEKKPLKFETPRENATIWRYMDFTEFVSLLERQELFFSRADKLGDPFEGACPKANVEYRLETLRKLLGDRNIQTETVSEFYKLLRGFTAVNCWHINIYESAAMWKLYLKSNEGIAIKSTFKRLRESLGQRPDTICKVQYIDYKRDTMPVHFLAPFMYKRKSFEHEAELRAIIQRLPKRGFSKRSKRPFDEGIYVLVKLNVLINRIYLAPQTPDWQLELVESVTEKYGLKKKVVRSILDEKPIY